MSEENNSRTTEGIHKTHDMRPLLSPNAPNSACHNCNACTCHAGGRLWAMCEYPEGR